MKKTSILRYSLFLGASALLLSQGCGEGGPGAGINTIEPPFGSAPPSDDRGGNPSSANNPFKASAPTSNDGYQSSPESGGYNAPSSGGGFDAPPGGGNCVNAIKQVYDRCGITEQISQYPQALAELDQILTQICGAISASPTCSACVLSQLPSLSCSVLNDDNNQDNRICEAACAGVDFGFDDGGGGSGGGGGAAGSGGGGNLCSRCGILDACPQLEFSSSDCAKVCNQAPPGCEPCIVAAGTDCNAIGACLASACSGGGGGSGGGAGSGGGGGGAECAKLASCCPGLDANFQPSCNAAVEQGQDATCKGFFDSLCTAQ
jgi:hypothetical protein